MRTYADVCSHMLTYAHVCSRMQVLETLVDKVPISRWSYEGDTVRHMGPMAQDFFDAFGLGGDRRLISSIDADGVAIAVNPKP